MSEKKYLAFKDVTNNFKGIKTKRIEVCSKSNGELLGKIQYNPQWRQYVFNPSYPTHWSFGCLLEVIVKINTLNEG